MIIDLEMMNESPEFECDLCIIGSGAAGLALTSELINTPLKIILLESGGMNPETATQSLYDVETTGLPLPGATEGRFRIVGGSTTRWGGQALPLMPIDFEKRDWVPNSGWPFSFDELRPYYKRACQFMAVDKMNFDSDLFTHLKTQPAEFDRDKIGYHFSKWAPNPNLRELHLSKIKNSERFTLLLHANVTKITLDENLNQVRQVEVHSLKKQQATIKARNFVICTGGIEAARLLLSNNQQQSQGIGNQHDLVGRYFQDHPSAIIGSLITPHPKKAQQLLNVFHKRGLKYSVRCTASPKWQREQQTLNISSAVNFIEDASRLQDLRDIYKALRRLQLDTSILHKFLRVASDPISVASPVLHYVLKGRSYSPNAQLKVGLTSEQEPNPESRILLSDRKDSLGIPISNIQWKLSDLTHHTMQRYAISLRDEFKRINIGDLNIEPWLLDNNPSASMEHITDQLHHIGTTRMHDSPNQGVVDRNCRVHGIENLYIGSSSVFPTSGHSNPTLTIIALCIRLADRLKQV